jgi:hypothetical protein
MAAPLKVKPVDRKIDFMIIGAQKAASSTLYKYLDAHQDIYFPRLKDLTYFERDEDYVLGEAWLKFFYRHAENEKLLGWASVHLMYFPHAPERIKNYSPHMKVLAVLRNPVERAYSAYNSARKRLLEASLTFEEALQREQVRRDGTFVERAELTYVHHGHYSEQLLRYYMLLGEKRVKVFLLDDLREDPRSVLREALRWLGVDPDRLSAQPIQRVNVAGVPRFPSLQKAFYSTNTSLGSFLQRKLPPRVKYYLRLYLRDPLAKRNIKHQEYPPISPQTRRELVQYFKPLNKELEELIGRDLSHWNK